MVNSDRVILAVLAHPDDESFGMGGTLAYYSQQGVKVYLVCATRGEVGEASEEQLKGFSSVGELREHELMCAASTLGLSGVYFLDYRDSGMPGSPENHHPLALIAQDPSEVVKKVVHYIRLLKPQVVLTFDPIGGYRHPDHIAIQQATEKAFFAAGEADFQPGDLEPYAPQKLYFNTMPKTLLKLGVFLMKLSGKDPHQFGRNGDIDLASIAEISFPINAAIDYRSVMDIRDRASACHVSQGGSQITGGLMAWVRRHFGAKELYMRAYPPPNRHRETNLFEGL